MNDILPIIDKLNNISDNALTAFIWYLAMDMAPVWVIIGLITWGIRTVWKHMKDENIDL
jgi:hypothetical protein